MQESRKLNEVIEAVKAPFRGFGGHRLIILAISIGLITSACHKDIHLDLSNASGITVIEGYITDQPGPYFVGISKTVTFYDSNNVVPVLGASLIMTDDAGNRDSLTDSGLPGLYQTHTIAGVVGRTYHLSVFADGKQYDAASKLNPPVPVDSVGLQLFGFNGKTYWVFYGIFKDPAATTDYYKAFLTINNKKQSKFTAINDQLSNGLTTQTYVSPDFFINENDTIQMELDAIDKPVYEYFNTLNESTIN
ncbi:MAG: hypothetical protein JWO03_2338, partial [Bacteroidetes bacterium]|nr:hypothetical protein [Bacteroidota bacterium]